MTARLVLITGISVFVAVLLVADPCVAQHFLEVVKVTASDADTFGYSLSIDGDIAVVGAPDTDVVRGVGVVFVRNEGGFDNWGEVARLVAHDAFPFDQLGRSVSIHGDLAVAGAIGDDDDTGAAYLFERNHGGPNVWGELIKLTASDAAPGQWFGEAVAVNGDTVVVGAPQAGTGSGYVF